ncbi:VOC family protein [Sulfurimonas sp.]|uniref:VOC family protein n=1 Tax=Sulfurimonas sp. TaxID=2022749 RepID=UPI003D09FA79
MKTLVPNMAVKSINETVRYYKEHFGFELQMAVDAQKDGFDTELQEGKEYIWAMIINDGVSLMLQSVESLQEDVGVFFDNIGASLTFYVDVEDADSLYKQLQNKVEIYKEIHTTWYGQREFYVKDINGYILGFASRV